MKLSNNGLSLLHVEEGDYRKSVKMEYDGLEDNIIINNASYLENLMKLKINKGDVPDHFESIIDSNMNDFLYTVVGDYNKSEGLYIIEDYGRKLVLKSKK